MVYEGAIKRKWVMPARVEMVLFNGCCFQNKVGGDVASLVHCVTAGSNFQHHRAVEFSVSTTLFLLGDGGSGMPVELNYPATQDQGTAA